MDEIPSADHEKENAIADWLTTNEPSKPSKPAVPPSTPAAPDESYDILGGDADLQEAASPVVPPIPPPVRNAPKKPKTAPEPESPFAEPRTGRAKSKRGTVDEVWTRWAEWGPDVIRLGLVAALLLVPLYLALAALQFALAFLILVGGGVLLGVLGYPLFITMERPVRITPEQAVNDFYAALSHPIPHFRRMWLLLSSAGRSSPFFSTHGQFKTYWSEQLARLKSGKGGRFNPLVFTVQDFKSEKSAGLTELDAKFKLNVRPRGEEGATGQTFPVVMGLVKGPDKMWYLDEGTMPKS